MNVGVGSLRKDKSGLLRFSLALSLTFYMLSGWHSKKALPTNALVLNFPGSRTVSQYISVH
jgi:hypothetical protein